MRFKETDLSGAFVIDPSTASGRSRPVYASLVYPGVFGTRNRFPAVAVEYGFQCREGNHSRNALSGGACTRSQAGSVHSGLSLRCRGRSQAGSPSYGKWLGVELSAENGRMLYVPELCAHGFQSLEDRTEVLYMTSAFYTPDAVRGVRFDDPAFNIQWPLPATTVSEQDRKWPLCRQERHKRVHRP